MTALLAAALCLTVAPLVTDTQPAGAAAMPSDGSILPDLGLPGVELPGAEVPDVGLPGVSLTLSAGSLDLSTGVATADLSNGANGPVLLTVGPCIGGLGMTCSGVQTEFWLLGSFKDNAGNPLYSDSEPAAVRWTCNVRVCPTPPSFVPGTSTVAQLQVKEFLDHTMYVALRNPDGTFQPYAPAPACNGTSGAPLPTGTIDRQDTGGIGFCVDVGAISRADQECQTVCSAWTGPLTLPILFVEDPKFMGT